MAESIQDNKLPDNSTGSLERVEYRNKPSTRSENKYSIQYSDDERYSPPEWDDDRHYRKSYREVRDADHAHQGIFFFGEVFSDTNIFL